MTPWTMFSPARRTRDVDDVGKTRFRVDREHHAGAGLVGTYHLLDPHGKGHLEVVKPLVNAIGDGAVREKGGKTPFAGLNQGVFPPDVEIGLLLAGKAGPGKVLGRSAAADATSVSSPYSLQSFR